MIIFNYIILILYLIIYNYLGKYIYLYPDINKNNCIYFIIEQQIFKILKKKTLKDGLSSDIKLKGYFLLLYCFF